jgi:hypothetical protein
MSKTSLPGLPPPRRYTIASFDNLVVLANYEEHLREARRMVWRDRGEPAVEVHDLWECLEHGVRGGLRTSYLLSGLEVEELIYFQEPGLLLLRFALALISSFSWHAYNESGRCLGLSRDGLDRLYAVLIVFEQKDAYFIDTTCSLWLRLFPFRRHAWFVQVLDS